MIAVAEATPPTICKNNLGQIGTFGDEQYDNMNMELENHLKSEANRQVTINRKRYIIYRSIQSMVYSILPLQTLQNNNWGLFTYYIILWWQGLVKENNMVVLHLYYTIGLVGEAKYYGITH